MKIFSQVWANAYKESINANSSYFIASQNWSEGSISLVLQDKDNVVGVYLELFQGKCLNAVSLSDYKDIVAKSSFVIEANLETWKDVLSGNLQPLMGIMRGKLKLSKGSITKLIPFTKSANELVISAQVVITSFD